MTTRYGKHFFGYFNGLRYGLCKDSETVEDFDTYTKYKNELSKQMIIEHIESLEPALATMQSADIFTGEDVTAGQYQDGDFLFPTDFLHYLKKYDIGVPYEYEEYLKGIIANGER